MLARLYLDYISHIHYFLYSAPWYFLVCWVNAFGAFLSLASFLLSFSSLATYSNFQRYRSVIVHRQMNAHNSVMLTQPPYRATVVQNRAVYRVYVYCMCTHTKYRMLYRYFGFIHSFLCNNISTNARTYYYNHFTFIHMPMCKLHPAPFERERSLSLFMCDSKCTHS